MMGSLGREGAEGRRKVGSLGVASPNIKHRRGEWGCCEPASPCRGRQRGRNELG